jgi:hypothetical protein
MISSFPCSLLSAAGFTRRWARRYPAVAAAENEVRIFLAAHSRIFFVAKLVNAVFVLHHPLLI